VTAASRYGSDLIVDLLVDAGIEHVAFNPGATFRGIHDSLVNLRDDAPGIVLCAHEGVSVAVAQGYAKAAGRPMAVLVHDVVGLQHASMAIYNAWCDRTPMLLIGGTGPKSKARRRPWIDWIHTAADQAGLIRDYVKWDDEPHDVESIGESFARAHRTAIADPGGPVYLCYDVDLQEDPLPDGLVVDEIASYPPADAPAPSAAALQRLADRLASASAPAIVAGHAGQSDAGFAQLAELAEMLAAPVVDTGVRLAFPTTHELNATGVAGVLEQADVVLALDLEDPRGTLGGLLDGAATVIEATLSHLRLRGWAHDYQPLATSSERLTASAEATVAGLLERLRAVELPRREERAERRRRIAGSISEHRDRQRAAAAAASADGAVPLERLTHDLGEALRGERFVLANGTNDRVEHRTWELTRPRQYLGWHGGGGLGYGLGATIGAALGVEPGTICVDVQADGDLLFAPAALWTLAHLRLPVLVVVHNNRQYANTVGHAAQLAQLRGRDVEKRHVGASFTDPPVDFASLAASFGVWGTGPIDDVERLGPALEQALEVVRSGRPALVDVLIPQL